MANVARMVENAVSFLSNKAGAGRFQLTRAGMELAAKTSGSKGKVLSEILSENPWISSLDVAYKAKSNYSIGAFRLMEGKTPYMTGAISVKDNGIFKPLVKFHCGGKCGQANGFYYGNTSSMTI